MITIYSQPSVSVGVSLLAQMVKNLPAEQETQVLSLGQEDPLEEGMAYYSSILVREFHGQRSRAGYSPWGRKGLEVTEQSHTHVRIQWRSLTGTARPGDQVNITGSVMLSHVPWWDEMRDLHLCGLPPQTHDSEKNIRLNLIGRHPTKPLPGPPQNQHGHQKQGKPEKLSLPEELRRQDD